MTGIAKLRGISNKKGILLDFRCMTLGKIIAQKKKKKERKGRQASCLFYFTRFKGKLTNKDELKQWDDTDIRAQLSLSLLCSHQYDNYGFHHFKSLCTLLRGRRQGGEEVCS